MSITIKHLSGPLQGTEQSFDDSVGEIVFGRDREKAQIVYPPEYTVVSSCHFALRRDRAGGYSVELFKNNHVAIDGKPADRGMPVTSGSTFRLGKKEGPTFAVEIGRAAVQGLAKTEEQSAMPTSVERLGKKVATGGGVLALLLAGVFAYSYYVHTTVADEIALARAEAAERAAKEFAPATLETLAKAVYLVAKKDGGGEEAAGTAFAFAPHGLATNAHVTEAIKGHEEDFVLKGPDGKEYTIKAVVSHPGYLAFKSFKTTQGTTRWGEFTPLDLINEYDVGIIEIEDNETLPVLLAFASQDHLEQLAPGTPVASMGFPVEGLAGGATATEAPGTLHFGHISALTDVFMIRADPEHRFLIQHSVPVTGGASGSPLIDPSGRVIGIVNGGNTTVFKDKTESMSAKLRVPSAALINFAQRADLLQELAEGNAETELAQDQTYWDARGEAFDDYFDVAVLEFRKLARSRYKVDQAKEDVVAADEALAGDADAAKLVSKSYSFAAEPGKVYGFIADAKSGIPVGINVKNKSTSEFLRDAKDPRQTSELELAPTAWVTVEEPTTLEVIVWSLVSKPTDAEYALHAFEWTAPKPAPSADAGT